MCTEIVSDIQNNFCTQHILPRFELGIFINWTCNSMNNLLSYCGLVDAKIRASEIDLPVLFDRDSTRSYKWLIYSYCYCCCCYSCVSNIHTNSNTVARFFLNLFKSWLHSSLNFRDLSPTMSRMTYPLHRRNTKKLKNQ